MCSPLLRFVRWPRIARDSHRRSIEPVDPLSLAAKRTSGRARQASSSRNGALEQCVEGQGERAVVERAEVAVRSPHAGSPTAPPASAGERLRDRRPDTSRLAPKAPRGRPKIITSLLRDTRRSAVARAPARARHRLKRAARITSTRRPDGAGVEPLTRSTRTHGRPGDEKCLPARSRGGSSPNDAADQGQGGARGARTQGELPRLALGAAAAAPSQPCRLGRPGAALDRRGRAAPPSPHHRPRLLTGERRDEAGGRDATRELCRTITWDQGRGMLRHAQFTVDTTA